MNLRRYSPMKKSRGTVIPPDVRETVLTRDRYRCVCARAGFPSGVVARCPGTPVELDHIRASHGMGMKSETSVRNLASLSGPCHRWKTSHGREARPLLVAYVERNRTPEPEHPHVEYVVGCSACDEIRARPLPARSAGALGRLRM